MGKYRRLLSSNLVEYFSYFLLLSLLVTFLLGGTMYYYSSAILRQEAIENSNNTLTMLKNAQELVLSQVDKTMEAIILDPQFKDYMFYVNKQDLTTQIHLRMKLDDVTNINDYIHSVYIYYYKDDYVLSTSQGPVHLQDFKDANFAQMLHDQTPEKKLVRTRKISDALLQDQPVISIVRPLPLYFTGKPSAYVVINIKGVYLQQVIDSVKTNEHSSVMVADEEGNVITRKAGSVSDTMIPFIPPDKSITSDTFTANVDNVDTLVSYLKSDKYGWVYVYAVPMTIVTKSISLWGKTSLILCVSVLVLSLIGSLFLSNRIFMPVRRMFALVEPGDSGTVKKPGKFGKEIKQIEQNVSLILDTNKHLTLMLKDYEIYTRNALFTGLLKGTEEVNDKLLQRITYYRVNLDFNGYFLICLIALDEYAKFIEVNPEQQRNAFVHHISELVSESVFIQQSAQGFIAESNANELALVLNFTAELEEEAVKSWGYAAIKHMRETLAGEKPYTFTIGVSTVIKGMKEVSKAYYEAVSALNFKLTLGNNHVIFNEHLVKTEKHVPYPLSIEKKLCSSLNLGDREAILTQLIEFQTYIYDNIPNSSETVRLFFLQLYTSSLKNMYEMDAYPSLVSEIGHMSYTGLLQQETIEGMIGYMSELYDEILSNIEMKRGQIHKEKMEAVSEYIRQHLSTDLKLERIAEQFYFSSSYLRKLFKDEYGLTLKEFILNERIALAKRLLEDPVLKISSIAEQVGYMSVTSFSKAFKSGTGTTPGEYRTRLSHRNFP